MACISLYSLTYSFPTRGIALASCMCARIKLYGMCRIILENISAFNYTNAVDLSIAQVSGETNFFQWLKILIPVFFFSF